MCLPEGEGLDPSGPSTRVSRGPGLHQVVPSGRLLRTEDHALPAAPRSGLADGAEERGSVHEGDPADRRTASQAGLTLAPVGLQRALEVAALPVDVDVERVEGGPALSARLEHHLTTTGQPPLRVRPAQP